MENSSFHKKKNNRDSGNNEKDVECEYDLLIRWREHHLDSHTNCSYINLLSLDSQPQSSKEFQYVNYPNLPYLSYSILSYPNVMKNLY